MHDTHEPPTTSHKRDKHEKETKESKVVLVESEDQVLFCEKVNKINPIYGPGSQWLAVGCMAGNNHPCKTLWLEKIPCNTLFVIC